MGFATHLGPWLLGTVKNTTGTTAGTIRNTGCTVVSQQAALGFADGATNVFTVPAGSLITGFQLITTTGYAGGTTPTITLSSGSTTITSGLTNPSAAGLSTFTIATTGAPFINNVGTTDAIITATLAGTSTSGASTLVVTYVVRNADGSQYQSTFNN
jgi:hypothetical protein